MKHWKTAPIGMDDAALALGVSRRFLSDKLKKFHHFEWRGKKKVFYPEHIANLRRDINECGSEPSGSTVGHMRMGPRPMVAGSDALSKLKMLAAQKKSDQS